MNWGDFLQQGLLVVLYALVLFSIVYIAYTLISHFRSRQALKCTEVIQAAVAVTLSIAAVFGILEYKEIRRPYVSLMNVEAMSNLSKPDMLVKVPSEIKDEKKYGTIPDELRGVVGKFVPAKRFYNASDTIRELVDEILVDLYFKNTGPLAATNCQIQIARLKSYGKNSLSEGWDELVKTPEVISTLAIDIILNPHQEQTYNYIFHKKDIGFKPGDTQYILCGIRYNSVKDVTEVKRGKGNFKAKYRILNLYKIFYVPAYTYTIYSALIKSEIAN